jgi:hypothetical protein
MYISNYSERHCAPKQNQFHFSFSVARSKFLAADADGTWLLVIALAWCEALLIHAKYLFVAAKMPAGFTRACLKAFMRRKDRQR